MDDRKPCPFCGSLNLHIKEVPYAKIERSIPRHVVECKRCLSCGPEEKLVDAAEKSWNTRNRVIE